MDLERPLGVIGFMFGINVQHEAEGFEVAREFVEVETGKGADALDLWRIRLNERQLNSSAASRSLT